MHIFIFIFTINPVSVILWTREDFTLTDFSAKIKNIYVRM